MTIKLTQDVLNKIKQDEDIVSEHTAYLGMFGNAIDDMFSNPALPHPAFNPSTYIEDTKAGILVGFGIDLNKGSLNLQFSETVNVTDMVVAGHVTLQSGRTSGSSMTLTGENPLQRSDSSVNVTILLLTSDLDKLKLNTALCVNLETSHLFTNYDFISDQAGVAVVAVNSSSAIKANSFVSDSTAPKAVSFDLNMDSGVINILYNEPIKAVSVDPSLMTLQNHETTPTETVSLTGTQVTSSDGTTVTLRVDTDRKNEIKKIVTLCISSETTFIELSAASVSDMANVSSEKKVLSSPAFTRDFTRPKLSKFTFALDEGGILQLEFDEPVNASSFELSDIRLQGANTSDGINELRLTNADPKNLLPTTAPDTALNVELTVEDGNLIKQLGFCTSTANCFVTLANGAVKDMNGLGLIAVPDGNAAQALSFSPDTTLPFLAPAGFTELDYNTGKATLLFSEVVVPSTINYTSFVLYDSNPEQFLNSKTFRLTAGSTTSVRNNIVVVEMTVDDLNRLKQLKTLCKNPTGADCWIVLENSFIEDGFGNNVAVVSPQFVRNNIPDVTAPVLQEFTIDIEGESMELTFDEPVRVSALATSKVYLQGSNDSNTFEYNLLQNGDIGGLADSRYLKFSLAEIDAISIKAISGLCTSVADCFISMASGVVYDVSAQNSGAGNPNVAILSTSALRASSHTEDTTAPTFTRFTSANYNTGELVLVFSEPVQIASLNFSLIVLQAAQSTANTFILSSDCSVEYVDVSLKTVIKITVSEGDRGLLQAAKLIMTRADNTYIKLESEAIEDMAKNKLASSGSVFQVLSFTAPGQASVSHYILNMNDATLNLKFTASMKTSSLNVEKITLQSLPSLSASGVQTFQLSNSSTRSVSGFDVVIDLGIQDLNAIKAIAGLATSRSTTFLAMATEAIQDVFDRFVASESSLDAKPSYDYIRDDTDPKLTSFRVALDAKSLWLTFSETMDTNSLALGAITLQNTAKNASATLTLGEGTYSGGLTTSVKVLLSDNELNHLKNRIDFGTNTSNTFLSLLSSAVNDTSDNQVSEISSHAALQAYRVDTDSVNPILLSFSVDLNRGIILLYFSETVKSATVIPSYFIAQRSNDGVDQAASPSYRNPIKLSGGQASQISATEVEVSILTEDLNKIKSMGSNGNGIWDTLETTYLALLAQSFADAAGNFAEAIIQTDALQASKFVNDTTPVELKAFELNLNEQTISLLLTETIDSTSLISNAIKLHSSGIQSADSFSYTLNGASLLTITNHTLLTLTLSKSDFDVIKVTPDFAVNSSTAAISLTPAFVDDVSGNAILAVSVPLAATAFTPDRTDPILLAFVLNMNDEKIILNFNEPVSADDVDPTAISLHKAQGEIGVKLTGGEVTRSSDGLQVTLKLTTRDVNALKRDPNLATSKSTTWLAIADTAFTDTSGNKIAEIFVTAAKNAASVINDVTRPTISSFDLDMNEGILTLRSLEPLDYTSATSAVLQTLTIQAASNASFARQHTLSGGTVTTAAVGLNITIKLILSDINALKSKVIGQTKDSSYLTVKSDSVSDMNGLTVIELVNGESALAVSSYIKDSQSPEMELFDFSLDDFELTMQFSETVSTVTANISVLTLLSGDSEIKSCPCHLCNDDEYINIMCNVTHDTTCSACDDTNCASCGGPGEVCIACKAGFLLSNGACFSSCPEGSFEDGVFCIDCDPVCKTCTGPSSNDCTAPCPSGFQFTIATNSCSETNCFINNDGTYFDGVTCASCATGSKQCFGPNDNEAISCKIGFLLSDRRTCVTTCPTGTFEEFGSCRKCVVGCDTCSNAHSCTVCQFGWAMWGGQCFVNQATAAAAAAKVQGTTDMRTSCNITNVERFTFSEKSKLVSGSTDVPTLSVDVSIDDMNVIKSKTLLAVDSNSIFATYSDALIEDTTGNKVIGFDPIPTCPSNCFGSCVCHYNALSVRTFGADTVAPLITFTALSMDGDGELQVVFSESVNKSSLDPSRLWIAENSGSGSSMGPKVALSGAVVTAVSPTTVNIVPKKADLDLIKSIRGLAIDKESSVLLIGDGAIHDNAGNSINGAILTIDSFTQDTTPPTILSFSIDMDRGFINITASETVEAASVDVSKFYVRMNKSSGNMYKLTGGTVSDLDSTDFVISLSHNDLNNIKSIVAIATDKSSTYLSTAAGAFNDTFANSAVLIEPTNAVPASVFIADTTSPDLISFALDMTLGQITISFSETINASSLKVHDLSVQAEANSNTPLYFTTGSTAQAGYVDIITLSISSKDLNLITERSVLAIDLNSTYLSVAEGAIHDMNGNLLVEIPTSNGLKAENYTADNKRPSLLSFTLDIHNGILSLEFSETVKANTFRVEELTLQHSTNFDASQSVTLTTGSSSLSEVSDSTRMVVNIGRADLNLIKKAQLLAVDQDSARLTITDLVVTDMRLNKANPASALLATELIPDKQNPILNHFDFDLNTNEVVMSFTETVKAETLNFSQVLFQGVNNLTVEQVVQVTNVVSKSSSNSDVLTFTLGESDLNNIKANINICTSDLDCFLTVGSVTVQDMAGNPLVAISDQNAMKVNKFTKDVTPPQLLGFDAIMNGGVPPAQLVLTFSETISLTGFNVSGITIQSTADSDIGNFRLTQATASRDAEKHTTVTLTLVAQDLFNLRALKSVARTNTTTYIAVDASTATDEAGVRVNIIDRRAALLVSRYTMDIMPPRLHSFKLDLHARKLAMGFSENVQSSTFVVSRVTLQATAGGDLGFYVLTSNSTVEPTSSTGKNVVIDIGQVDFDGIKIDPTLAVSQSSTYISLAPSVVIDTAGNMADEILNTNAISGTYIQDQRAPILLSFGLNMTSGILQLTFDQVMNVSSFDLSGFGIQNMVDEFPTTSARFYSVPNLAGSVITSLNGKEFDIQLTQDSANKIRALPYLAATSDTTFLVVNPSGCRDVDNNQIREITSRAAIKVARANFIADSEPPVLEGFAIDMSAGSVTLNFNQPVDWFTLNVSRFTLQDGRTGIISTHTLTGGVVNDPTVDEWSRVYSTAVVITLSTDDLNEIKKKSMCSVNTELEKCFISFTEQSVSDTSGNIVPEISTTDAVQALKYIPDTIRPYVSINGFKKFDVAQGLVTIEFSETVARSSFNTSALTLQSSWRPSAQLQFRKITVASVVSVEDGTIMVIELSRADKDAIDSNRQLCSSGANCYISAAAGFVADMSGNPLTATVATDLAWAPFSLAGEFVDDKTKPELIEFTLNMTTHSATLSFSESVDPLTLDPTLITFQSNKSVLSNTESVTLSLGDTLSSPGPIIVLDIATIDINRIKEKEFCLTGTDAFLSIADSAIKDMSFFANDNVAVPVSEARLALSFGDDRLPPKVTKFSLDLDLGLVILNFSEPVRPNTVDFSKITLQNASDASLDSSTVILELETGSVFENVPSLGITLQLTETDITSLKGNRAFATATEDTFVSVLDNFVQDTVYIPCVSIPSTNALRASSFVADKTAANLLSFDLNLENRTLSLTFDEIMAPTTFEPHAFVFVDDPTQKFGADATPFWALTTSTTSSQEGTVIVVDISDKDLLGIGLQGSLATNKYNTFMRVNAEGMDDIFDRDMVAITNTRAQNVRVFTQDLTKPVIKSSKLDLSSMTLDLVFSEAVNLTSFQVGELKFQGGAVASADTKTHVLNTSIGTWASDQQTIFFKLNDVDEDALKGRDMLCDSDDTAYLVFPETYVADLLGNFIEAADPSNALKITTFIPDTIKPTMESFVLDMDIGKFSVSFSEVIRANTVDPTKFTLQNRRDITTDSSAP